MATAAEVDAAFRLLLGRAPDPAEAADWLAAPAEALRAGLMATDAFRMGLPADAVRMALDLPPPAVVWQVDAATEAALLARVQARWTRLGEERPHWSVAARPEFAPDRIAANRALFDASGEGDLAVLLAVLARHGLAPADLPRACDYGCGVGRMTLPMSRRFAAVTGCDVSAPHLTLARQASGAGVAFALVSAPGLGMAAPFDLWFSTLTLQHNPPPVIAAIAAADVRAAGAGRRRGVPAADRAGRLRVRPGGLPRHGRGGAARGPRAAAAGGVRAGGGGRLRAAGGAGGWR